MAEDLVPACGFLKTQDPVGTLDRVDQVTHPGRGDRQRPSQPRAPRAEIEFHLPAASRSRAAAFSASRSASSCAEPRCSMLREPRRDDHTTWTAVAPEAVFTVRT